MSGSSLAAAMIAVVITVVIVKRIADHFHGSKGQRVARIVATIVVGVVLQIVLSKILMNIPTLAQASYEASKLRMVIFAGTLIILMLLRPQGVFAHHEFSWDWLKRLFQPKETA